MNKPQLLERIDETVYRMKLENREFHEITADAEEIKDAKIWCHRLMGRHFPGDRGLFMWNGVKIIQQ